MGKAAAPDKSPASEEFKISSQEEIMREFLRDGISVRKGKLHLFWRGLGDALFDYEHTFATRPLSYERLMELEASLQGPEFDHSLRQECKVFNIIQADAPPGTRLPKEFSKGHYAFQARMRFGPAGTIDSLDESLVQELKEKTEIEKALDDIRTQVEKTLDAKPAVVTRHVNEMNKGDWDSSWVRKLPEHIVEERRLLSRRIDEFQKKYPGHSRFCRENGYSLEVTGSLEAVRPERFITPEELLKEKWVYLDIEIPLYKEGGPISWVGLILPSGKRIHTLRSPRKTGEYEIICHGSERQLIDAVADDINREDPFVIAIYNASFDLLKLREHGKSFKVGSDSSNPKIYATISSLMKRVRIEQRQVYDLLGAEKASAGFLPNKKLETTATHRLGHFSKSLTYDEMEELEKAGTEEAYDRIAGYLAGDMDVLPKLVGCDSGKQLLRDYVEVCSILGIELTKLAYSPSAVTDAMDWDYFLKTGTFRDMVYPPTEDSREIERKAKRFFGRFLRDSFPSEGNGLFKGVSKVFLPVGDYLRSFVMESFPKAREFFSYKYKLLDSPERQYFLSQIADVLASRIVTAYADYCLESGEFEDSLNGMPMESFSGAYEILSKNLSSSPNSMHALRHLRKGTLKPETILRYVDDGMRQVFGVHLSDDEFAGLVKRKPVFERSMEKKKRRIGGNFKTSPEEIGQLLEEKLGKARSYFEEQGLQVIASEGRYLYLSGCSDFEKAPLILVDKISSVYVADKPYHKRHGAYSGLKITGKPGQLCVFEQEAFSKFLNLALEGNPEAIASLQKHWSDLASGNVEKEKLVFYTKSRDEYSGLMEAGEVPLETVDFSPSIPLYQKRFRQRAGRMISPLARPRDVF